MGNGQEDTHQYDDIINLPCHVSQHRPHMPIAERAAQFSPFAALSGYDDAIKEARRFTEERIDLDEDCKAALNRKLALLKECLHQRPEVTVTFFQPDDKKEGGAYQRIKGRVRRIDSYEHRLIMEDGTALPMEDMIQMDSSIFNMDVKENP